MTAHLAVVLHCDRCGQTITTRSAEDLPARLYASRLDWTCNNDQNEDYCSSCSAP